MQVQIFRLRTFALVAGVAILLFSGLANADPPSRVARLGYIDGSVSFSPAGESDWDEATINRPLTTGDRVWSDSGARAEIQVGGAMIRMSANTGVSVLNLDDRIAQLQLTQGTLNVRVRRLEPNQVFEVDTPNLAFTLRQPGAYRIEVDPDGNATTIVVRKGQGEVYGEDAAFVIDSGQPYRFTGTGLRQYEVVDTPRRDEFDRWASDRDRSYDNSGSARYVSPDVVGYQDLDANGSWRVDPTYGNVWVPNRVAAGWAPYRDGHWAWVDPWGWTWIDDAPWGFAVSHYGRWTNLGGTWGWVPGPVQTRAYYAPALVAFVGGDNFQLAISSGNVGGVAWFPLAPREVYRPSYPVSRRYFENINHSNTVINNTVINNTYNTTNVTNVVYANRQVPGAVVAVPIAAFAQSQPVARAAVRLPREVIIGAPVAVVPSVAPTEKSVRGAATKGSNPPSRVFERPVVGRNAPPAAHPGFAAQRQQLSAQPGKPLDDAVRKELKPAAAVPVPVVKVVTPTQATPPTARPPPLAPGAGLGAARGKPDAPATHPAPVISGAPGTQTQGAKPSSAAPPATPQAVAQPQPAQRQATPPVPAAPPAETHGKSGQRGNGEMRGAPRVPPPPQRAAEATTITPRTAAPESATQAPPQRPAPAKVVPPPAVALPAPTAQQPTPPAKPEPGPAAKPAESRPVTPRASPSPPASKAEPHGQEAKPGERDANDKKPPAQRVKPEPAPAAKPAEPRPATPKPAAPKQAPKAEPHAQEAKPATGEPNDRKKDDDEQKREEESRKRKE